MKIRRPSWWPTGILQQLVVGVVITVVGGVATALALGILPSPGRGSSPTEEISTPVPTTAVECLFKMSGDSIGIDAEDIFERLSAEARHFSALMQENPAKAQNESPTFIDNLRFQSWKLREMSLIAAQKDIEFAGEIFDTAMAAVEAADLLYFDSRNYESITDTLARVSATADDLAIRIDYGC